MRTFFHVWCAFKRQYLRIHHWKPSSALTASRDHRNDCCWMSVASQRGASRCPHAPYALFNPPPPHSHLIKIQVLFSLMEHLNRAGTHSHTLRGTQERQSVFSQTCRRVAQQPGSRPVEGIVKCWCDLTQIDLSATCEVSGSSRAVGDLGRLSLNGLNYWWSTFPLRPQTLALIVWFVGFNNIFTRSVQGTLLRSNKFCTCCFPWHPAQETCEYNGCTFAFLPQEVRLLLTSSLLCLDKACCSFQHVLQGPKRVFERLPVITKNNPVG